MSSSERVKVDRCPTCGSSNPWFTDCKDKAVAEAETGRKFPSLPGGCIDAWHDERILQEVNPNGR